jgi:hypothetical protein
MAEVNTFNDFSIASREESPLISNMSFLLKPQVGAKLFDVNPMESDLGDFYKMGLMKEVKGEDIIHHEANKRYSAVEVNQSATVGNVYGTANGAGADPAAYDGLDYIQLSASSHSPSTGTNANKLSYPRVGQLIEFKNGAVWRIAGKRETVAGEHRLYITKVQAGYPALSATITNVGGTYGGDKFAVYGYAFEEATSGMQKGLVPTSKTFTNNLQSFYDYYEITDFSERNETYPLQWHGKTINFWYVKGLDDTEQRFLFNETYGLFLTPKDDGNLVSYDADGNTLPVGTTQGYIPNLKLNAAKLYYNNNPTIALFEQIIRLRRKLHQGRKALVHMGFEFELRAKDIISEFGKEGGMVYNRQAADLNISQVKIGNFEFNMREMQILNHPEVTAIDGFEYPWYFIVAPMDKTKDPVTNKMNDAFNIIYKKMVGKGARGHYKIWETGGNSATGTDGQLVRNIHIASRKGTRVVGASKHILGRRSA